MSGEVTYVNLLSSAEKYKKKLFMKKHLIKFIPDCLKQPLRKIFYFPIDIIDGLNGRDSMTPPKSMNFVGSGDFEAIGQEFKNYLIELTHLQPDSCVLDVGCGIGRMAAPLTGYLSQEGEYSGFDIVNKGIEWCQSRISSKFSNFHFLHSDVYNRHYNPKGKLRAHDFQFPYDDEYFDSVFLTSVFTHMLPFDMENYLREVSRVLKTGSKCLITFFIMNEESESLVRSGSGAPDFMHEIEGCLINNENDPEAAVAYYEESVKKMFKKYGLKITQPIHYGSWCGRSNFLSYQDIIVAVKEG